MCLWLGLWLRYDRGWGCEILNPATCPLLSPTLAGHPSPMPTSDFDGERALTSFQQMSMPRYTQAQIHLAGPKVPRTATVTPFSPAEPLTPQLLVGHPALIPPGLCLSSWQLPRPSARPAFPEAVSPAVRPGPGLLSPPLPAAPITPGPVRPTQPLLPHRKSALQIQPLLLLKSPMKLRIRGSFQNLAAPAAFPMAEPKPSALLLFLTLHKICSPDGS